LENSLSTGQAQDLIGKTVHERRAGRGKQKAGTALWPKVEVERQSKFPDSKRDRSAESQVGSLSGDESIMSRKGHPGDRWGHSLIGVKEK